jgi:hypothetical protein
MKIILQMISPGTKSVAMVAKLENGGKLGVERRENYSTNLHLYHIHIQ